MWHYKRVAAKVCYRTCQWLSLYSVVSIFWSFGFWEFFQRRFLQKLHRIEPPATSFVVQFQPPCATEFKSPPSHFVGKNSESQHTFGQEINKLGLFTVGYAFGFRKSPAQFFAYYDHNICSRLAVIMFFFWPFHHYHFAHAWVVVSILGSYCSLCCCLPISTSHV